jgi:hypothetical protein
MIISDRDADGRPRKTTELFLLNKDGTGLEPLGVAADEILTPVWWHP